MDFILLQPFLESVIPITNHQVLESWAIKTMNNED